MSTEVNKPTLSDTPVIEDDCCDDCNLKTPVVNDTKNAIPVHPPPYSPKVSEPVLQADECIDDCCAHEKSSQPAIPSVITEACCGPQKCCGSEKCCSSGSCTSCESNQSNCTVKSEIIISTTTNSANIKVNDCGSCQQCQSTSILSTTVTVKEVTQNDKCDKACCDTNNTPGSSVQTKTDHCEKDCCSIKIPVPETIVNSTKECEDKCCHDEDKLTTDPYKKKWIKYALILAYFTIFYNIAEGTVSIAYGAEDSSVSLAGFGFDSIIEVISAFFVLYRLARETGHPNSFTLLRERVGTIAIGILFIFFGGNYSFRFYCTTCEWTSSWNNTIWNNNFINCFGIYVLFMVD